MSGVLTLLAGAALAAAAWWWSLRSVDGSSRVAIVAVLGVTAAAFNVVVPVPSIEAYTLVILCTAIALGARTATATGLVAIVASSVTGGIGTWTLWQVTAAVVIALLGAGAGRVGGNVEWFSRRGALLLALGAGVAAAAWDTITTAGSVASYAVAGSSMLDQVTTALLLGTAFTVTHVAWAAAFTAVAGPSLLHALDRARPRLDGGLVA